MKIDAKEFEYEEKYLREVQEITRALIAKKMGVIEEKKKTIVDSKKHLWQNLNEYTGAEMYNAMDEEDLNVGIINSEIIKVARLERSLDNSFFGRIDFKIEDDVEKIYVGITGIESDCENYVYDWRAPIANAYYNYGLGSASYTIPTGKVDGEITLKRQFKIVRGTLKDVFNSDISLEDEILQETLLESSTDKMKNIVSTIQKEQNAVIRFGGKRHLIVEGVAGSGKTSVALHRIAYLLYNQNDLTDKNVLIFSPNDVFTDYISDVLPELGEENVQALTMDAFAKRFIPKVRIETLAEFIERFYRNNDFNTTISDKMDIGYKIILDDYIEKFIDRLTFTKKIGLKKKFVESDELNAMFKEGAKRLSLADRIRYVADKLCDKFDIDIDKNTDRFVLILKKMLGLNGNVLEEYRHFLGNDEYGKDGFIPYEDLGAILYLHFELDGYPNFSHIKHVIVDEAQDYTPLQFIIFKNSFKGALFTVLGDKNQAINPYLHYDTLERLLEIFEGGKYERLGKTYRSSREIIEFTNSVLGLTDIESVRIPTKWKVVEKMSDDSDELKKDIEVLCSEFKRIAVITKTMDESTALYDKLASEEIGIFSSGAKKRVLILPSYLAKGLEFEAVIVYTPSDGAFRKRENTLYYVALTRAQHALIVYNQKTL